MKVHFKLFSIYSLLIFSGTFLFSCGGSEQQNSSDKKQKPDKELTFREINGIRYYEVKRRFSNGLSFNKDGFMQIPTWIIEYKHPDTMLAYSPEKKGMEAFYLHFDHGRVYNFAREYFRLRRVTKDSIVLQRLEVKARMIEGGEVSDVISTYYTMDYIQNVLKTTVGELQRPTKADTAYITSLSERTYRNPGNPDTAFAATEPVIFKPKSNFVTAAKINERDTMNNRQSYAYMYPEYRLEIKRAYRNFNYRFSVVVDVKGNLYVNRVEGVMPDDMPARKKLLQGITDVYLKNLFTVIPGKTLGIPHSSEVTINLKGIFSQ